MRREFVSLILVLALIAGVGAREPRFFQPQSIESVLLWMPIILVAACGQLMVILTGGIDISIGSTLAFSGIATGLLYKANPGLSLPLAITFGLACGLILGLVNGVLVAWAKVSPLIVTIGTLASFRGLTFLLSKGDQIDASVLPDSLTALAHQGIHVGSVTISWLLVLAGSIAALTAAFLHFTRPGRNLFAFGSNPDAAHLRGISSRKVLLVAYVCCGALAGLAGVVYAARFGFVNPGSAGQNFELTVIAAVAVGGAKLTGGSGSVLGTILGCLLLSCINVALSLLGIDANWQLFAYGCVILIAILIDGVARRSAAA